MSFINAVDISKTFGHGPTARHVLRGISITVDRGEFVAIVGPMGSGKSTLLNLLSGLLEPDADTGTITIDGTPVAGIPERTAVVFQNYSLLPWFTALENVRLAVEAAAPTLSKTEQKAKATDALQRVGLGNALDRRPRQLSGGMRQRVAIARALATEPEVLFLDEPFGALDALTRETLQADLVSLVGSADRPVTTVMVTNSVEEALLLADRIVPVVPGPPATLGASISVPLPRPRTVSLLAHDAEASHVRARVVATLAASAGRRRARGVVESAVTSTTLLEVKE